MIKVALINTEKNRGGAARIAALLAQSLNVNCNEIEATLFHCEDDVIEKPYYGLKKLGSRQLNVLLARIGGSTLSYDFGVAEELIKLTEDMDVLHLHNMHGYYLDWVKLLEAWKNRPVVWTWHDQWGATGRCGFSIDCDKWKSGCDKCMYLKRYPTAWIDRAKNEFEVKSKIYENMQNLHIVSPSEWLANIAIERGFTPDNVSVIANPVDLSSFKYIDKEKSRSQLGLPLDKVIVLFIAADCNDPRKGFEDFADITKGLDVHALAVGLEPENKTDHIDHVGEVQSKERLAMYYSAADVMIFTSKADNYPNTVIECLICGTPVIAYAVGGVVTQLAVEYCNLVEYGDRETMRDHLAEMIKINGKNSLIEETLTAYAKNKWADHIIAKQYRDMYLSLKND